jgi:4,5-DOPA dioxygenase extradiol
MSLYPAIFIGHGNPMNALEDNEYSLEWELLGSKLSKPKSVVCISAHWVTNDTLVTAMDEPRTIHDFYGFPEELSQIQYPAPGDPVLAMEICKNSKSMIKPDHKWGLDHGCWSVLKRMFPEADIPVIQISLNNKLTPSEHFELAQQLKYLRTKNILILGSGNIVHNLSRLKWSEDAHPWAVSFDALVKDKIIRRNFSSLTNYQSLGENAIQAIPSVEHYLPLLYILGLTNPNSKIDFFCEEVTMGSISMRSLIVEN